MVTGRRGSGLCRWPPLPVRWRALHRLPVLVLWIRQGRASVGPRKAAFGSLVSTGFGEGLAGWDPGCNTVEVFEMPITQLRDDVADVGVSTSPIWRCSVTRESATHVAVGIRQGLGRSRSALGSPSLERQRSVGAMVLAGRNVPGRLSVWLAEPPAAPAMRRGSSAVAGEVWAGRRRSLWATAAVSGRCARTQRASRSTGRTWS